MILQMQGSSECTRLGDKDEACMVMHLPGFRRSSERLTARNSQALERMMCEAEVQNAGTCLLGAATAVPSSGQGSSFVHAVVCFAPY
mmetsp:Transcript_5955/g.15821  ORF Transcript_5955/g.15821 Transcript_5955/m.15821 type:complete len:87 (+) Transcript_5955:303-563(+)